MEKGSLFAGGLIFSMTLLIFVASPLHQVFDSRYAMLVSQAVLEKGSFALDDYFVPPLDPSKYPAIVGTGYPYQIELVNGKAFYYFPPGTSVLSIPYVAVMRAVGVSTTNADGAYDKKGEVRLQAGLAALLMATLASLFFFTSRLLLPLRWSALVALVGALGTQVWSTASRGLWSHTWGIFLLGIIILMLTAHEQGKHRMSPIMMATLLSWAYFVRPTNAISILTITLYVLIYHRRFLLRYALTGAAWLAAFVAYSWHYFHQVLPHYYYGRRFGLGSFWLALGANLISPSRGVLVFVPVLFFVVYLLVRYWEKLFVPRLAALALATTLGHLVLISGFRAWWGGHCYGPRFTTDLVPWFVLLAILGISAMLESRPGLESDRALLRRRLELTSGAILVILSVLINARGAISPPTSFWNVEPVNVDLQLGRIWDWKRPQFLAGLLPPRPP